MTIETPSFLSDELLITGLKRLAGSQRAITVQLILHLAEFDARRLHLGLGYPSLFVYCREVLLLSEQAAYHRIMAARAVKRYPVIAGMLVDGSLNLSTLRILAPHLSNANHAELVAAALGKSKREVEELVAGRFPQPDRPASIRRVPSRPPAAVDGPVAVTVSLAPVPVAPALAHDAPRPIAPAPLARPAPVTPRAEDRFEFRFNGNGKTRDNLRLAQDLLRHAVPDGDMDEIMARALTALVEKLARDKFAATDQPAATARSRSRHGDGKASRHIPAAVERVVWARDQGRCAFVAKSGRRCEASAFLEFHHIHPHGVGGPPTVENIALRCQAHNLYEADVFYGLRNSPRGEFAPIASGRSSPRSQS